MTLQDFARATLEVIHQPGVEKYLPTIILPDTQELRAIRGIPDEIDHRDAIQQVVIDSGFETREFFFGVKSAPHQIIVGHFRPGYPTDFMEITESSEGCCASSVTSCDWWRM